jgi:hypothetical protein
VYRNNCPPSSCLAGAASSGLVGLSTLFLSAPCPYHTVVSIRSHRGYSPSSLNLEFAVISSSYLYFDGPQHMRPFTHCGILSHLRNGIKPGPPPRFTRLWVDASSAAGDLSFTLHFSLLRQNWTGYWSTHAPFTSRHVPPDVRGLIDRGVLQDLNRRFWTYSDRDISRRRSDSCAPSRRSHASLTKLRNFAFLAEDPPFGLSLAFRRSSATLPRST